MKKLALFFAIITNFACSQVIISYAPDSICVGDTVCAKMYNPYHLPFYFNFESNNPPDGVLTWIEQQTTGFETDTMTYCFEVPGWLPCGHGFIGINLESLFPIYFKCDCFVGIKEHYMDVVAPVYFDLMGLQVDPVPGVILVEQRGTKRRKVVFTEK